MPININPISLRHQSIDIARFFPHLADDPQKIEELDDYWKDLEILAKNNISIQFNNSGKEHAALVMSKLFTYSHSAVKMFAGDFNGAICDNEIYLKTLDEFLDAGKKIEVVFERKPNNDSKAFRRLKQQQLTDPTQVSLTIAAPEQLMNFRQQLKNKDKSIHFATGDNDNNKFNKYRCETDTEKFIAILNFDDERFCKKLLRLHEIVAQNAVDLN
jgi:hypothetical protein